MIIRGRYIEALATIHVKKLRPQDLTDDELKEFGLMEDDLVERLRGRTQKGITGETALLLHEAADRIEQLERELARQTDRGDTLYHRYDQMIVQNRDLREELAAEKALADQAADLINGDAVGVEWKRGCNAFTFAHRKARGL